MPHSLSKDVDEIAQQLIDAFDLMFEEQEQTLSDPLVRWLDFRLRYIDPRPRTILRSIDFDARVPPAALSALEAFIELAKSGKDLNPFQTKTIKRHDTSGTKRQLRTDGLWADWHLHHAHLTEVPLAAGAEFSERSEWLLFFLVLGDQLALIDVRSHNEPDIFQAIDLVQKAIRSWPQFAEKFAVQGVIGLAQAPTTDAKSVRDLRKGGVAQMLEIDGNVYMPPGLGVTSAATSTQVSLKRNRAKQLARDIGDFFVHAENPLMKAAIEKGVNDPTVSLDVLPSGQLTIYCLEAALHTPFPSAPIPGDARSELEQLLLPRWAGLKLVAYLAAKQADAIPNSP